MCEVFPRTFGVKASRNCTTVSCENHRDVSSSARRKRPCHAWRSRSCARVRRAPVQRSHRPDGRGGTEARAREHDRAAFTSGRFSTSAPASAARRSRSAGGAALVTAIDSSDSLLHEARRRAVEQVVKVNFLRGDAHALEFKARSFDVVVCLGVLLSTRDWRQCLAETCRVADRLVIFDYPSATSAAFIHANLRRLFRSGTYRVLTRGAIEQALERSHFRIRSVHRQCVMPMWFHRAIGSAPVHVPARGLLRSPGAAQGARLAGHHLRRAIAVA